MRRMVNTLYRGMATKKPNENSIYPTTRDHELLGVDRNTNIKQLKNKYHLKVKLFSSRTLTMIEKESQMKELQRSYDLLTSYYSLAEVRQLPQGQFSKYDKIRLLLQKQEAQKKWREPWWNRYLWYSLIVTNGAIGYYLAVY